MARAIWSGVLTFGLVSVPVELYSATEAQAGDQFEKGTADRIRYQRVNERTTDEVEYSDIVKGAEEPDRVVDRWLRRVRGASGDMNHRPRRPTLRSSLPRVPLTAARDCQRQLELQTAQLPDHSDTLSAAQHLARLTSEIISEVAEHQAADDDPAGHRDKCHHRGGGDDTAVRDLSG